MGKIILMFLAVSGVLFWFWQRDNSLFQFRINGEISERLNPPREIVDPLAHVSGASLHPESPEERLTFSNTMTLGSEYRATADRKVTLLQSGESRITLPDFPANTSERTKQELALLHEYIALRTPERLRAIQEEITIDGVRIGPEILSVYLSSPRYTATGKLIRTLLEEIEPIILRQKLLFNRVRPDKLDPSLTTAIDVPAHPAYPSGHATQAFAVAQLFGIIDPQHQSYFYQDALRVATNREIAGVHYPSDSAAGKILAEQVIPFFVNIPSVAKLIEEARPEWSSASQ